VARRRRPSRSALVLRWLAVAVLAVIALSYIAPIRSYRDAREEVARRGAEVAKLKAKRTDLRRRIEYARTDAFVEREARKLGLVRPGERLFIVKWKDD
jgi:cell division protein FtsB